VTSSQRLRVAEERALVVQVSRPRDSLEPGEIDPNNGQRMLLQLPLEPLVVRPYASVRGKEEVEAAEP
jgi:hypothetical protein